VLDVRRQDGLRTLHYAVTPASIPIDARPHVARYAGRCASCRKAIPAGRACLYSPRHKALGCQSCWSSNRMAPTPPSTVATGAPAGQVDWERLCTYLRDCLLAEATENLIIDYSETTMPMLDGSEGLFSSRVSTSLVSGQRVSARLKNAASGSRDLLYGWPLVVMKDRRHRLKAAPLFVASVGVEPGSVSGPWKISLRSEPDLNTGLLGPDLVPSDTAAEMDAAVAADIGFGNLRRLLTTIKTLADILGLPVVGLDSQSLDHECPKEPGIYNCAVILNAGEGSATRDLIAELEILGTRTDWVSTAAALLIPHAQIPPNRRATPAGPVAAPIRLNQSQEEAVESARHRPLTVVTGPPGTGKSQVVLCAVANAWLDGETVLVSSTNNGAVDVAVERANQTVPGLLLRTGNKSARDALPSAVADVVQRYRSAGRSTTRDEEWARSQIARAHQARRQQHELLARIEALNSTMTSLALRVNELSLQIWGQTDLVPEYDVLRRVSAGVRRRQWIPLVGKHFVRRLLQHHGADCTHTTLEHARDFAKAEASLDAQRDQLSSLDSIEPLDHIGSPEVLEKTDQDWIEASITAARCVIARRIHHHPAAFTQMGMAGGGGGKVGHAVELLKRALRGWACTALSMKRNFPLEASLFDLAVIDEASQCSMAHMLPIAYRARRLLVVGDPNQLTPVVHATRRSVDAFAAQHNLTVLLQRNSGLDFKSGSGFHAFARVIGIDNVVLLNEHYRCHPKIARWFNQAFYGGALEVMTDISAMNSNERGISWIDVDGRCQRPRSGQSWENTLEAQTAVDLIAQAIGEGLTIGAVSPFAGQASAIERAAVSRIGREQLAEAQFAAGTAHRFQGDERDIIVFSSCIAPGVTEQTVKWVENERNLINVAVSRARQRLVVIGHPRIGSSRCATLSALRSFVLDASKSGGAVDRRVDSRPELLLLSALQQRGLEPLAKIDVDGFELDFAILREEKRFNIEVDGDQHFTPNRLRRRQDIARDSILDRSGWIVIRVPAWRCTVDPATAARWIDEEIARHIAGG